MDTKKDTPQETHAKLLLTISRALEPEHFKDIKYLCQAYLEPAELKRIKKVSDFCDLVSKLESRGYEVSWQNGYRKLVYLFETANLPLTVKLIKGTVHVQAGQESNRSRKEIHLSLLLKIRNSFESNEELNEIKSLCRHAELLQPSDLQEVTDFHELVNKLETRGQDVSWENGGSYETLLFLFRTANLPRIVTLIEKCLREINPQAAIIPTNPRKIQTAVELPSGINPEEITINYTDFNDEMLNKQIVVIGQISEVPTLQPHGRDTKYFQMKLLDYSEARKSLQVFAYRDTALLNIEKLRDADKQHIVLKNAFLGENAECENSVPYLIIIQNTDGCSSVEKISEAQMDLICRMKKRHLSYGPHVINCQIGPKGGVLNDKNVTVSVEAGSVVETITLTLSTTDTSEILKRMKADNYDDYLLPAPVSIGIEPHVKFKKPVTTEIQLDERFQLAGSWFIFREDEKGEWIDITKECQPTERGDYLVYKCTQFSKQLAVKKKTGKRTTTLHNWITYFCCWLGNKGFHCKLCLKCERVNVKNILVSLDCHCPDAPAGEVHKCNNDNRYKLFDGVSIKCKLKYKEEETDPVTIDQDICQNGLQHIDLALVTCPNHFNDILIITKCDPITGAESNLGSESIRAAAGVTEIQEAFDEPMDSFNSNGKGGAWYTRNLSKEEKEELHRKLILEIQNEVIEMDFRCVKYACEAYLKPAEMERVTDFCALVDKLKSKGYAVSWQHEDGYSKLIDVFNTVKLPKIVKHIQEYRNK